MKNLPYFKFDAESWLSGRIQYIPVEEIGIYINLVARIWKSGGELRNDRFLPRILGASREQFDAAMRDFLELDIITETDDGMLRIKFIDDQLAERQAFIERCSNGGRKSQEVRKATPEQPSSDLQGNSTDLEHTPETPSTNKNKSEIREDKNKKESENNNAPALKALGPELAGDFRRFLDLWRDTHGGGREMPFYRQEAQIRLLLGLPEEIRAEAIESAIRGGWKAIHDIRLPRNGEGAAGPANGRKTGTLTEEPIYKSNERGKQ